MAIILSLTLIVAVIPLIKLAVYSIPWYDDYNYAKYARSFRVVYGDSFFNALRGTFFQIKETWYAWQGTFSSVFFMSLCPIGWGEQYYKVGVIILIILFTVSVVFFVYSVTNKIFGIKSSSAFIIAVLFALLALEKMYFPGHAFYWFNGGVHYIGIQSFLFLLLGVIAIMMDMKGKSATVFQIAVTMLLALIVSGGNFVTVLQGMLMLIPVAVYCTIKYKKRTLRLIPPGVVYITGMIFNLAAPGNAVRASRFVGMSPFEAVKNSFPEGIKMLGKFSDVFLVIVMLLMIPAIWTGIKDVKNSFRFPIIFIAYFAGLYFATYTPGLYGTGKVDLARVWNICKLTYQLALVFSEIYLIGWIKSVSVKNKKGKLSLDFGYWWYYVLGAAIVFLVFFARHFERYDYASYGAFYDVHSGEANVQYMEYEDRLDTIRAGGTDVTVTGYTVRPWYLRQTDLSENPNAEENTAMANWYGKNSITMVKKQ